MGSWVIGHNMAGYLPESDTLALADWDDAATGYRVMVVEYCDTDDDHAYDVLTELAALFPQDYPDRESGGGYGDDEPSMRATADSILTDDPPLPGQEHGMVIVDGDGRPIAFWLTWSPDRLPDDDTP